MKARWYVWMGLTIRVGSALDLWVKQNRSRILGRYDGTGRQRAVSWGLWGARHEPQIHYSMQADRDDWLQAKKGHLPLVTDCSGFVTLCYRWAGLPDPNGLGYRTLGWTGTLLDHHHVSPPIQAALPADLIVIGPPPGDHVVMVVERGRDPLVVSHGSEGGPRLQRLSVDGRTPKTVIRTLPV